MRQCSKCNALLEESSRFCGVCGTPVEAGASSPPSPVENSRDSAVGSTTAPAAPRAISGAKGGVNVGEMPRTLVSAEPPPVARPVSPSVEGPNKDARPRTSSKGSAGLFSSSDPYVGTTLNNRFVVESKLGEGGFGAVYKGVQQGTNRIVALKLLHPEMTRDKNVVQRFRREGQVLCSLKDAHTVTTYDFDQTEDGTLFIAMELLEGVSLHDVFGSEAPIPWSRMLKILSEMCTSLGEAHALGVVHRDLKPENIHLERRGEDRDFVKILDFGIAKMLRGDGIGGTGGPQLTATGQTLGTLEYMSPEQLMGKDLDGRSDIYGMGVLAYELMTGRLPFPDAVGPAMLISAQLKKVPEAPSTAFPAGNFPRDVDALILKMLQKLREDRFADVAELRQECLRILTTHGGASQEIRAKASSVAPPAYVGTPMPQVAASPISSSSSHDRLSSPGPSTRAIIAATTPRPRRVVLIAGALILAAIAGGVFLLVS